jgi:hypothetical protein
MQDTAPCAPQRSPLCLSMPAPPRRHPMLPGLMVLLLSVTTSWGPLRRSPVPRWCGRWQRASGYPDTVLAEKFFVALL